MQEQKKTLGKQWSVIGNGTIGSKTVGNTVTLLSNEKNGNSVFGSGSNHYADSTLKEAMENAYKTISEKETGIVLNRTLDSSNDGINGATVIILVINLFIHAFDMIKNICTIY